MNYIGQLGKSIQGASKTLVSLENVEKNNPPCQVAMALVEQVEMILAENVYDSAAAKENGISDVILDRLCLNHGRIKSITKGVGQVADLQDPIGQVVRSYTSLDSLKIVQKCIPLGVVVIVFESHPNASVDVFFLAFKTGNAIILRDGRDAIRSSTTLIAIIRWILVQMGIDADVVQLVGDTSHATVEELIQAVNYTDMLVPHDGARLIQTVKERSKVPIIGTEVGSCHIYVDDSVDLEMAVNIVVGTKTQRLNTYNAAESLVVHKKIAEAFLPRLERTAAKVHPVEFRTDQKASRTFKNTVLATEEDYNTESLDYIMSIKVVKSVKEAIDWINSHTTHRSEAVITQGITHAEFPRKSIGAMVVYINTSVRFTDGFVLGLGVRIRISTQEMHAHGPMGLEALIPAKSYINGKG